LIQEEDCNYVINRILNLIGGSSFEREEYTPHNNIEEILDPILDYANENGKLEVNSITYRDILSTDIMDCFTPMPSEVIKKFYYKYQNSPKEATDWFFEFSKNNNYIMTERLKKNIVWKTKTKEYGDIDLTINLSKPEKDPRDIANAKKVQQTGYPKCLLCVENVGFEGHSNHPPRSNHRIIPVDINGKKWYLQYSPYGYYNEHCILLDGEHSPMAITIDTFGRLLAFVEKFPHYFIGSNADLPIVGGSILTHDHYQGGNYEFPMAKCGARIKVNFEGYSDVEACVVDWALSTIRIASADRFKLQELAGKILVAWREYSDEENEIYAYTDAPHNTITPIARMRDGKFELDLILRNNRTTEEHPLGLFHPHAEYHHIKKENIGLIEAMGLAVLPPRLTTEYVLNDEKKEEIGIIFGKILENCGVFK
ncbi:MAG: UDP-glucose--hexose-1-phosphate uridylyltransferase, partial [Clostridia bacterium]|nr:UDP-glucose--hexose-1-phosphate uridylyltransferase [Clostridia bacterium]